LEKHFLDSANDAITAQKNVVQNLISTLTKKYHKRIYNRELLLHVLIAEVGGVTNSNGSKTRDMSTLNQTRLQRMAEADDVRLHRRSPMHSQNGTMCNSQSRPGSKLNRMMSGSVVSSMPQVSTMMHPVKEINRISQLIVEEDYDAAILSLTKALKNIKLVLSGDAKIAMPKEPESIESEDQMSDDANWIYQCDCKEEQDSRSSTTSSVFKYDFHYPSQNSSSFLKTSVAVQGPSAAQHEQNARIQTVCIFKNPLIVKGDCFGATLDSHLCEELSSVAIYNLALSHQLKAIALSTSSHHRDLLSSQAYLYKALNLYEYSHQIFKNQAILVRVPAIHCMALVSNLGQIHHLLGDAAKAQQCNEYLLSVLMYTIDGRKAKNFENRQKGEHLVEGFLAIVQHLIISNDCTAPAA
jgi:hypothetical protein